jgi:hypothetical protein
MLYITAHLKKKGLEWLWYLITMDQWNVVKKIFEKKKKKKKKRGTIRKKGKGRPRLRWLERVGSVLRELELQNNDARKWPKQKGFCKKAKGLRGPYSQGVNLPTSYPSSSIDIPWRCLKRAVETCMSADIFRIQLNVLVKTLLARISCT